MMMKKGIEADQDDTVLNYRTPIPQRQLKYQVRTIVAQPGMKPAPKCVLPGNSKEKTGKEPPPRRFDKWIIWKHSWQLQWIRIMATQV